MTELNKNQPLHCLPPAQIVTAVSDSGVAKASAPFCRLLVLGILAGAYVAIAAAASNMAAYNLLAEPSTYGLGRCLAGVIFPGALILIVIAGGELFTGNTMMLLPLAQRRIGLFGLLRNWSIVYVANFAGALCVAWLIVVTGQLNVADNLLGGVTIKIATAKCRLPFANAFLLGIFCNWLVCLAVWMAMGAKDATGKIFAIFFPIWLFITAGFEHSIANMYYIPAGLFAKSTPLYLEAVSKSVSSESLASLTWTNFFVSNLLPVTLGNIVGGGVLVALAYGLAYSVKSR